MSTVLKEVLTKTYKKGMISWMETHPEEFDDLVEMALSDDPEYAWRAAWLLWSCITENDPRIRAKLKEFANALKQKPGPQKREFLILFNRMDNEPSLAGDLYRECVRIWTNPSLQTSLRYSIYYWRKNIYMGCLKMCGSQFSG
jgi:hypothetical protein